MADIDGIGYQFVREGQHFVGIIGGAGGGISAGRYHIAGGNAQFIQVDSPGGTDIELVRRGLGESAGAGQISVDEVIEIAA